MLRYRELALVILVLSLATVRARAQETAGPDAPPPPPPGVDKTYWDLSHSKDLKTKSLAERYLNMVKFQEWSDASGKFKTMAKYVSHDPELKRVKLSVPKGTGKTRTLKEVEVEVAKLSKACQSRVKQIDTLQKKLDELAATATTPGDGSPMLDERGADPRRVPGPEGQAAAPGVSPTDPSAAQAAPDPSASEPDPLGFAEVPLTAVPEAGALATPPGPFTPQVGVTAPVATETVPSPTGPKRPGEIDHSQWRNSFPAFFANFTAGTDPSGKPQVDFGELAELRQMNDLAQAQTHTESPTVAASPEAIAISERIGDVHWQLEFSRYGRSPSGAVGPQFKVPELPKPLELEFALDQSEAAQDWSDIPPGTPLQIAGRLQIVQPNKISVTVRKDAPKH